MHASSVTTVEVALALVQRARDLEVPRVNLLASRSPGSKSYYINLDYQGPDWRVIRVSDHWLNRPRSVDLQIVGRPPDVQQGYAFLEEYYGSEVQTHH